MNAEALVLTEPHHLEPRFFPIPDISDDDGLLRVEACGLCGTDHEQYTGHIAARHAFIPGHEVIGTIEQIGERASERWGVAQGDRVAVEVFQSCRECDACQRGMYRRCERNGLATMVGFVDVERPPSLWGGYATHLYLGPDSMLLPVPDELDPVLATMFNPLGAGIRWAVDVPGTVPGDVVAILGPGVRGLCAAAAVSDGGAGFVMMTGRGARDIDRLALAASFGAHLTVDVETQDPSRALKAATGGLADVVIDVTAKAPAAFTQALSLARPGGTVVVAGTRGTVGAPDFTPDLIVYKELRVFGALGVDVNAYRPALEMLARGSHPFASLPREVAGFDDVEPLIQRLAGEREGAVPVHAVFSPTGGAS